MDENRRNYWDALERGIDGVISGRINPKKVLAIVGQLVEKDIKATIVALKYPPNAPATVEQKGSDNPLIDSAGMLNSIRYEVKR